MTITFMVQEWHGTSSMCGQWPVSSRTHFLPGSISLAVTGTLWLDAGPQFSPPVPSDTLRDFLMLRYSIYLFWGWFLTLQVQSTPVSLTFTVKNVCMDSLNLHQCTPIFPLMLAIKLSIYLVCCPYKDNIAPQHGRTSARVLRCYIHKTEVNLNLNLFTFYKS
jgi:hypothetical protein